MDYEWIDSSCIHPTNVHTETFDGNGFVVIAANPHRIALHVTQDSGFNSVQIFVEGDPASINAGFFQTGSTVTLHWWFHGDLPGKQIILESVAGNLITIVEVLKAQHERTAK